MSADLFNVAQAQLSLADVFMRKAEFTVSDAYDHLGAQVEFDSQYRHIVTGIEQLVPADGAKADRLFRALVDVAVRWGEDKNPDSDEADDDDFIELGRIEAQFVAEYTQRDEIPEECLHAFAMKAPSFHVWPYWREFVASTCARMNVPKIVIPPMSKARNAEESLAELMASATTSTREFYAPKAPHKSRGKGKKRGK
jgi:hypothetical protein